MTDTADKIERLLHLDSIAAELERKINADKAGVYTAAWACGEYERWAAEVQRLSREIGDCRCPKEEITDEEVWSGAIIDLQSCFSRAKSEETDADSWRGISSRPPTLDEIEEEVWDCPACMRLVSLIRERKAARQKLGGAKRRIRYYGKIALMREEWRACQTEALAVERELLHAGVVFVDDSGWVGAP